MGLITYENLEDGTPVTANVFNERFAQIIAQINGNIDENNLKDAGISKAKLKAEVYESIYPVGSMYVNFTDNTDPATLLGFGTWTQVAGRVVVGYDASQTEFNAAEKTGGEKTHTLTEAELAPHDHTTDAAGDWGFSVLRSIGGRSGGFNVKYGTGSNLYVEGSNYGYGDIGVNSTTANAGGGAAHNNLQPYIVGYIWKRVS